MDLLIRTYRSFLFCSVLLASVVLSENVDAQEESSSAIKLTAILRMQGTSERMFDARVKISEGMNVDTKYKVHLKLVNPYEFPVSFSQVISSCSCGKVTLDRREIPAKDSVDSVILIETPKSTKNGVFAFGFDMVTDSDKVICSVNAVVNLLGSLEIDDSRGVFDVTENSSSFRIPVNFTKPIFLKNLVLKKSDSFKNVDFKLVHDDEKYFLQCSVLANQVGEDGVVGSISLQDRVLGAKSSIELIINKAKPLVVSPILIRFRNSDDNPKDYQKAKAMIQLDRELADSSDQEFNELGISVSCSIDGTLIPVKTRRLSDSVFRASMEASLDLLRDGDGKLVWQVQTADKRFNFNGKYLFEEKQ